MSTHRKGSTMAVDLTNLTWLTNETEVLAKLPHYAYNGTTQWAMTDWMRGKALPAIPYLDTENGQERDRVLILLVPRHGTDSGFRTPEENWAACFAKEYLNPDDYLAYAVWKYNFDLVCGTDWPI